MMVPFQLSTLPVTPWKNGGGETREIICVPAPDAPFLWRASIATLQADGPFSPFPGVDRVITLLAGQPLRLCGENIDQPLALWQPWAFPGEWALSSVGIVEPGLDFNVMTQRASGWSISSPRSRSGCPASRTIVRSTPGKRENGPSACRVAMLARQRKGASTEGTAIISRVAPAPFFHGVTGKVA